MELREALDQISEIRLQLARVETFRGYKAIPVALSGLLAFVAAALQTVLVPDPTREVSAYLILWLATGVISGLTAGLEMGMRYVYAKTTLARETTLLALEQFLPCLVAGILLTYVLVDHSPESLWMLPGLWAMFFSLGIFASHRLLPRPIFGVGVYYLCAGMCCLAYARGEAAFSPWAMGLTFGCGQLFAGGVLYWTLERGHEQA